MEFVSQWSYYLELRSQNCKLWFTDAFRPPPPPPFLFFFFFPRQLKAACGSLARNCFSDRKFAPFFKWVWQMLMKRLLVNILWKHLYVSEGAWKLFELQFTELPPTRDPGNFHHVFCLNYSFVPRMLETPLSLEKSHMWKKEREKKKQGEENVKMTCVFIPFFLWLSLEEITTSVLRPLGAQLSDQRDEGFCLGSLTNWCKKTFLLY